MVSIPIMADAPNPSNNSTPKLASHFSLSSQPTTEAAAVTTMAREYEFFVTTTKPHLPDGAERGMIRRLVMRNFFETKTAALQVDKSEHSSATTVMARQQLSSRFRLQKSANERETKGGKSKLKNGEGKGKGKRRSVPRATTEACLTNQVTGKKYSVTSGLGDKAKEEMTESTWKVPKLRLDPSAHRIDPFDILPIPGSPQFHMLFQLCTYGSRGI
jgi:hypothetical protein